MVGSSRCAKVTSSVPSASMASTTGSVMTSPLLSSVLPPPLPELEAFRLTMTVTEADAVPLETTMEVAPVPTAVMTPLALTVATLVSLDLKVRDWEAEDGVTLPVMVRLAPGLRTT